MGGDESKAISIHHAVTCSPASAYSFISNGPVVICHAGKRRLPHDATGGLYLLAALIDAP